VVTPFVEFLPNRSGRYWVTDETPRVLTPVELQKAVDDEVFGKASAAAEISSYRD
jgi:hypothetical protein